MMVTGTRRRFLAEIGTAATLGGLAGLQAEAQNHPTPRTAAGKKVFRWPKGKRAAVRLAFDDARLSQIDTGLDLLDKSGVKATFCILPDGVKQRLEGWKRAVANGHEIGNHTMSHPCTGNYGFSTQNVLENYTLEMMAKEIDDANSEIHGLLGVSPKTFSYPCSEMFVGRGRQTASYVHLIAERFVVGLGASEDWTTDRNVPVLNDPATCDLAYVHVTSFGEMRTMDFDRLVEQVSKAVVGERWLVLRGHEFGDHGRHVANTSVVESFCQYVTDPSRRVWVDTVGHIGRYIQDKRAALGMEDLLGGKT